MSIEEQKSVEVSIKSSSPVAEAAAESKSSKMPILGAVLILAAIFGVGLNWVFGVAPDQAPFLLFSYAVGLTMIFLPCTLPLAFVIVPLSMGKSPKKGIGIALAFSLGVIITLSIYGALIGTLGNILGIGRVEMAKNILYALAGLFGITIALGELGLIKFKMPMYSGGGPGFIQKQSDYLKAMLLGLFLGNIGVGCPNPLFNAVILPQIIVEASAWRGFLIMFIHALGRVTPLLILAFLAILGVNATGFLTKHKDKVTKSTAWAMVFVGGFLFMIGAFGHDGYTYSGIHSILERITQEEFITNILGEKIKTLGHGHEVPIGAYLPYAVWAMLLLWLAPMWWWYAKEKSNLSDMTLEEEKNRAPYLNAKKWFLIATSAFLLITFGWVLPHQFLYHSSHNEAPPVSVDIRAAGEGVLAPNIPMLFSINIKDAFGAKLRGVMEYGHERLIHVIAINDDFNFFTHIHPEDEAVLTTDMFDNGAFPFHLTFPGAGRYLIAAGFVYKGEDISFTKIFNVGERNISLLEKDFSRQKEFEGYNIAFAEEEKIVSGREAHIKYTISKDGNPVADLAPYLGAPMHFAIVSADLSGFAHTHGTLTDESMDMMMDGDIEDMMDGHDSSDDHSGFDFIRSTRAHGGPEEDSRIMTGDHDDLPAAFGPDIYLHYTFPRPGIYVIFSEFKHNNKVVTTKFMVEVEPSNGGTTNLMLGHGH